MSVKSGFKRLESILFVSTWPLFSIFQSHLLHFEKTVLWIWKQMSPVPTAFHFQVIDPLNSPRLPIWVLYVNGGLSYFRHKAVRSHIFCRNFKLKDVVLKVCRHSCPLQPSLSWMFIRLVYDFARFAVTTQNLQSIIKRLYKALDYFCFLVLSYSID